MTAARNGLYEVTEPDGTRWITNLTRKISGETHPGRALVNTAAILLGLLDAGLFAVSLAAQYQYIFHAKHQSWPAIIEAVALDAGMVIFSLLALGLARGRQAAPVERALIVVCAFGSAAMNYGAADVSSPRSVAAYVMPPVFGAIVTDRVISTVRRHMLGMEAERSAWAAAGRAALAVLATAGKTVLYGLRLVLAPRSTLSGARVLVLLATPLPGAPALARTDSVREAVRTELEAVRDAARTEADSAIRSALGTVRAALGEDLRELREAAAASLDDGLHATRKEFRTEIASVREAVRTEIQAVRNAARTEAAGGEPPAVDRDAVIAELAGQIRDAIRNGERWTPDYDALMARTGYRRSWCEKAVRDARTAVLSPPDGKSGGSLEENQP